MMGTSRMLNTKSVTSIAGLFLGVIFLAILVSTLTVMLYGPSTKEPTTVIVERPRWNNYRGWWGHYGAGLPGWGGPKYPPMPPPHPKPSPPPGPSQPPPPPSPPAQPPPPPPSA